MQKNSYTTTGACSFSFLEFSMSRFSSSMVSPISLHFFSAPDCGGGVSRARSLARAYRRACSISVLIGCAPPRTRSAIWSVPRPGPAAPGTTRARCPILHDTNTRVRGPPPPLLPNKCSTSDSGPTCPRRTPRPRPRRPLCIFCLHCTALRCRRGVFSYTSACGRGASGHAGKWHRSISVYI